MKIERLILQSVGCFDQLDIHFQLGRDPRKADIHLLVGPNGSGKTTILMALAQFFSISLTGIEKRLHGAHSYALLTHDFGQSALTTWEPDYDSKPPYGAEIMSTRSTPPWGDLQGWHSPTRANGLNLFDHLSQTREYALHEYRVRANNFIPFDFRFRDMRFSHMALFYTGQRSLDFSLLSGIVEQNDAPLANIRVATTSDARVQPLLQWIANTKAKAAFAREDRKHRESDRYRDAVVRIEQIVSRITGRSFAFVLSYEPINVSASIDGEELAVEVLPDGIKSLISWIGDLLMRMDRVPWVDDTPLLDRAITLFLDEIEVHLHPAWQRKVLPVIQDLFPNAQVFVSTHSPFIIASADDAWIYPLYLDEKGRGHVGETLPSMLGNSYATVLRDVLGIEAEFAPQVDEQLKVFYDLRDRALRREPGALEQLQAKGRELGTFGEEVLAIVHPELRQVERRLAEPVMETSA